MTDQEKKVLDDRNWPTMIAIRLLVWTLVFSFVALVILAKID